MKQFHAETCFPENEDIHLDKYTALSDIEQHTHDFIEMVYITSGKGMQFVDGRSYEVGKGSLLFINFKQTHSFRADGRMDMINILFKPEFLSRELLSSENIYDVFSLSLFEEFKDELDTHIPCVNFSYKESAELEAIIETMFTELEGKQMGYQSILKSCLQILIARLIRKLLAGSDGNWMKQMGKITPDILSYIDEHCLEHITISGLAELAFYHPTHFNKLFRDCFGKGIKEYITEKRMDKAIELLQTNCLPVDDVCAAVGYTNKKQFYKLFKEHTGKTPGELRKRTTKI